MIQFRHMALARWMFTIMAVVQFGISLYLLLLTRSWELIFPPGIESEVLRVFLYLIAPMVFMGLFLAVLALCTWVESWTLTERSLTHAGLFRTRKIELSEVEKIRWWPFNRMILVYGFGTRIPIFVDSLPPARRARLIEQLHRVVPVEQQSGWQKFEKRTYQPLLSRLSRQSGSAEQPTNRQTEQNSSDTQN